MKRRTALQSILALSAIPAVPPVIGKMGPIGEPVKCLSMADIQNAVRQLEENNVPPSPDGMYTLVVPGSLYASPVVGNCHIIPYDYPNED